MIKEELANDNFENVEVKKEIVRILYEEGNNDIDPCVGIIDTGAPKTVAGRPWLQSYLSSTGQKLDSLKIILQINRFRFGNGPVYESRIKHRIKVDIGKIKTLFMLL